MKLTDRDKGRLFILAIIVLGIIATLVIDSCGPTPEPVWHNIQATPASVQQQAIHDSGSNCAWNNISNPVVDCSARKLECKSALGNYMECIFIRCGTSPVLSCIKR